MGKWGTHDSDAARIDTLVGARSATTGNKLRSCSDDLGGEDGAG
jgi:hypothetical protein